MMKNTRQQKHSLISEINNYDILLDTREIFLHGSLEFGEDTGVDHIMANQFLRNIRLLESFGSEPIVVHQHSIGGNWDAGIMIYDIIAQSQCPFVFMCHGMAASMGSIIPQAAHDRGVRVSMPNCDWLIHDGVVGTEGTLKQFSSYHEYIKKIEEVTMNIYTTVCSETGSKFEGKTSKQVNSTIRKQLRQKEDWWLTPREAVEYGFADAVLGDEGFENIKEIKSLLE